MTSYYNGKKFKFDIFKDHVSSTIDKFNAKGEVNGEHTFYNGYQCYYEETDRKNGVIVEAEVKRFKKQEFIKAVESQLQFIKNVDFIIKDKLYNKTGTKKEFHSTVLYQNEDLIVGESDYWAVPQILLKPGPQGTNYINYGKISFEDLEMKDYKGNVSFIIDINEVDVVPSREAVIWNGRTKETIKKAFLKAQKVITDQLEAKIVKVENFFEFCNVQQGIAGGQNAEGYMKDLYKITDLTGVSLKYRDLQMSGFTMAVGNIDSNTAFPVAETKNYSVPKGLNDLDYKGSSAGFSASIGASIYNSISGNHNNDTVVYVGATKLTKIAPYLREKAGLSTTRDIKVVYIKEGMYNKVEGEMLTDPDIFDEYVTMQNYEKILIASVQKMVAKSLPIVREHEIDKTRVKELEQQAENVEAARGLTEGEQAKAEGKTLVYSHSNLGYASKFYVTPLEIASRTKSHKVIIYRRVDSWISKLLKIRGYNSVPSIIYFYSCPVDAYDKLIALDGVMTFAEACYTIKYGDIKITRFGRLVFGDTDRMIEKLKLSKHFKNKTETLIDIKIIALNKARDAKTQQRKALI